MEKQSILGKKARPAKFASDARIVIFATSKRNSTMVYFLTRGQHRYTLQLFQEYTDAKHLAIIPYEELDIKQFGAKDVVVFCDIDRCSDDELEDLKTVYLEIEKTGCQILNNPSNVMRRYQLLRGLYSDYTNDFQAYRLCDLLENQSIRFPVFLRNELEHDGPASELMTTYAQLEEALANDPPPNPLVCEYVDTSIKGHYHKYGAFVLGEKIIPRHFFLSDSWNVKSGSGNIGHSQQLEMNFVMENPHEKELLWIAKYAHIDYGRIDYAITENGIQVFEINTNPTVIDLLDLVEGNPRHFITQRFIDVFSQELKNEKVSPL
jgi:hypothetical protein